MKPWARKFYKSEAWKKCRKVYIISKQGLCERCMARGRVSPGEIVHHKVWLTPDNINNPQVSLNFDNLELLCYDCHNKEHMRKIPISDEIFFNDSGEVVKR